MSFVEIVVWSVGSVGWMLDWASTVWPNKALPEQNPLVVRHFGEYPSPVPFGLAKLGGLALTGILYVLAGDLFQTYSYLPVQIVGLQTILLIPVVLGAVGWHGFLHNLRLHLQIKENNESF